jgi:hypothetical protein
LPEAVNIKLNLPTPHSKKQKLIIQALNMPDISRIYVACGTKFGKSISGSASLSNKIMQNRNALWRWIAPYYDQAKIGMDYFKKMLPPEPHTEFVDGKMRCKLPFLRSELEFWHAQKPTALEGAGVDANVFDEAAKIKFEAIASARTTTTRTAAPELYLSTPLGKGWFYRECMEAKDKMRWAVKNGKPVTQIFITARTIDNPYIQASVVKEMEETLPARLFRQFYLAEFMDDGSVFVGIDSCTQGEEIDVAGGNQYWVHKDAAKKTVVIGADWAKQTDYTVFTAIATESGKKPEQVGFQRFQGISYVEQIRELVKFCAKFKDVRIIFHDRTGVGEALDDMLSQIPYPFEGIVFTNSSKAHMVSLFMLALEKKEVILCNWKEQKKELEAYTVVVNELGNARYSAPQGFHDDIVSSLILCNAALQDYAKDFKLNFLEDLPKSKREVDRWYRELLEDSDNPADHLFS